MKPRMAQMTQMSPDTEPMLAKRNPNGQSTTPGFNLCESVKSVDPLPFLRQLRNLRLNPFPDGR